MLLSGSEEISSFTIGEKESPFLLLVELMGFEPTTF